MTDLHTRLVEAITARLNLAEAVDDNSAPWDGQWKAEGNRALRTYNGWVLAHLPEGRPFRPGVLPHIAANDPAFVIGACRADLELLEQHKPPPQGWLSCSVLSCSERWPCTFVRNRAGVYGVNLDEQEG